jgi:hypothetical protein
VWRAAETHQEGEASRDVMCPQAESISLNSAQQIVRSETGHYSTNAIHVIRPATAELQLFSCEVITPNALD